MQPIVLNERQAGAAIEGVVRDEALETSQLAVDTHGYTDVAMALSRLLGFDLCPRLKALSDRQAAFDRLNARRATALPPELIGRIAPTRTEGINLRGVFRFPFEAYADRLLPGASFKAASAMG